MTNTRIDDRTRLRPEVPDDYELLAGIYASTREEELRPVDWSDEVKQQFLRSQFDAQSAHYRQHYARAELWVIERDGLPIGRLYLNYLPDDLRIVDIALAPEARGQRVGGTILEQLLADAVASGRGVSIHVEMQNPALRLYERLGFRPVDQNGVYLLMRWKADQVNTAS